ncbi:MAG: histidinol-phosphate transaminase [Oscillospiraceae bacterium]|jgi:histidinol-phosphate aminotransferase|nr:histidinol-phosphate transaminase [Oscillospiraceae bacterium]
MSRFFSARHADLQPYVPGEQPRGRKFIKLNTNEAPFPSPPSVMEAIANAAASLELYSDPTGAGLRAALAEYHGVKPENITLGNGSDETLAFAFSAFCDDARAIRFPDITYGFYPVFARFFNVPFTEIPVDAALAVRAADYIDCGENIVLASPNAPTGLLLTGDEIERIAASNPDRVVIIDEAYADFAGQTAIGLTGKYDNLLVVRTYSKSRFLAGARLGYAVGNAELIQDLETVRYSFNPYNVNSLTLAAGAAALREYEYYSVRWQEINTTRDITQEALRDLGFTLTDSRANFIFTRHPTMPGEMLYARLRARGFLVRSLPKARIRDYLRITVGAREDMEALVNAIREELT